MTGVIRREEFLTSSLDFGTASLDLADYATTGLRIVTVGPSGIGKTNAGLLIAEQLTVQGWICVLLDPEGEIESLYGDAITSEEKLEHSLRGRHHPYLVVKVHDAAEFVHYGRIIMRVVDEERKPVFLMVDEGQMFSASRRRKESIGEASDLVNDLVERGRKRALDLFFTAHRYSNSLHRSVFTNKNLTFVGRQEDPTAWSALAPQFRGSKISYTDLAALAPGEFFCFSRRGVDKVRMPMAAALKAVAMEALPVVSSLPQTFSEWDSAMRRIPTERLRALTEPVQGLLSEIAGLTFRQRLAGARALRDELTSRADV